MKKGGGSGERNFNRKKVKVNTIVAKIKRNKRIQKGIFNVNELHKDVVSAKKVRREEKKDQRKQEKKARNQQLKEQKASQMVTEPLNN